MVDVLTIGLTLGCTYALVAIGFSLIYATTGVVNFAQGSFVMVAGMVAAWATRVWEWPLGLALLAGVASAGLAGLVLALGVVIPLWKRRAPEFITILGTLMFLVLSENVVLNYMGSAPITLPALTGGFGLPVGARTVPSQALWVVLTAIGLALLLTAFLNRRRLGTAMRATSYDRDTGRLLGISPNRIAVLAIVMSAVIGGVGGVLIAPLQFTAYNVAAAYSVKGFLAAVVSGLGNIKGAVVGGVLVGILEALISIYVSSYYLNLFVMAALVAILLVRPQGMFGRPRLA
jgi:branched-chain amino acid transport system permease protein